MAAWPRLAQGAAPSLRLARPEHERARRSFAVSLALVTFCLAWVCSCTPRQPPEPDPVLTVDGAPIPHDEAARELRGILWGRSIPWESQDEATRQKLRREAVDACIMRRLLASFATDPANAVAVSPEDANLAFQQFIKQFPPPDGWKERVELQQMTEQQWRDHLTAELAQTRAVEKWLKTQRASAGGALGESAGQAWYAQHKNELLIPERVRVSHIFLSGVDPKKPDRMPEMLEILRKLTAGEATFPDLAAQVSDDDRTKKTAGDLGWLSRDRVPRDFAEGVFAAPVGKLSPIFRTSLGWHIAWVQDKKPPRLPAYTEVKQEILALLESRWREQAIARLQADLRARATVQEDPAYVTTLEPAPW